VAIDGDIWCSMNWPAGWDVRHVDETGSTNADLIAAVATGAAAGRTVLVADHQTAGRGRLDRRWEAPPGANLLVSIVIAPIPAVPAVATHRVGVAAVEAVRRFVDADVAADVGLKWPNDVLVGDRKLAGILAQRVPDHDAVVVGLGLNVGWAPDGAAAVAPLVAASEAHPIGPARLLQALLEEIDALPTDVASRYVESLVTIGRWVRVEMPGGADPLYGRAVGIDEAGRLLVTDARGRAHALDVGDVVHVRALDGENQV
jgi:BirA family transcriptional regulator, biotin operon repressor / biotin---[acetyl-CoA-carboxylase] ligase